MDNDSTRARFYENLSGLRGLVPTKRRQNRGEGEIKNGTALHPQSRFRLVVSQDLTGFGVT